MFKYRYKVVIPKGDWKKKTKQKGAKWYEKQRWAKINKSVK